MSDPRFARLKTDPRFRQPKKKQNKVIVDERFKSVFEQGKKKDKSKRRVDKYGRTVSATHEEDNLKRFYRLEGEEGDEEDEVSLKLDLARGEVLLESSDEEDLNLNEEASDSDTGGVITLGGEPSRLYVVSRDDEEVDIDLDENNFEDLEAQAAAYSKDHPGHREDEAQQEVPRTRRLAIVNLDWDHVRAGHLYKICSSLVSSTAPVTISIKFKDVEKANRSIREARQVNVVRGKVLSVVVYLSEFGKERLAREETEGPPPEIFKRQQDDEEVNEKNIYEVGGEDDVDEDALRKYQLERLRYYYAVVSCDTVEAASHIYNELEGTELERSANVFDMSFVPDGMTFENDPREEATDDLATNNKGVDFVTDALRHSKVRLTWDEDDPERNRVTRRALTLKEIEDDDFRAYIANTSSDSEAEGHSQQRKKNKKSSRDKLRALLLGGNEEAMPEGWGDEGSPDDVDMEITFTPGLAEMKGEGDETTLESYQRKMKEKRKNRKEELKGKASSKGKEEKSEMDDDFFDVGSDGGDEDRVTGEKRRKDKGKKKQPLDSEDGVRQQATEAELALLVASDNPNAEPKHFNLTSVLRAEKKGKKGKKVKHDEDDNEVQQDFVMDVKDARFKALHEDHQFAIDPSNPHFKKTKAMEALLEERRKRTHSRQLGDISEPSGVVSTGGGSRSLQNLVENVKRKSAGNDSRGLGKRRKL